MNLLDAARRLAETEPIVVIDNGNGSRPECVTCFEEDGHTDDCPWLAMPRIVAALEAAERVTSLEHERDPVNCFSRCHWCDEFATTEGHRPDCPWQALVAALKGVVVP